MVLKNINHSLGYHTRKIVTMFFPLEKIAEEGEDSREVITELKENRISVKVRLGGNERSAERELRENEDVAQAMSLLLYGILSEITGFKPPWGILYGVRPARLMHAKTELLGEEGAKDFFRSSLVTENKIDLAVEVMKSENRIISLSSDNSFSLYISIPFCPSRCSYCSFVSHSIENAGELIEPYLELLIKELEATAEVAKTLGLRLEGRRRV